MYESICLSYSGYYVQNNNIDDDNDNNNWGNQIDYELPRPDNDACITGQTRSPAYSPPYNLMYFLAAMKAKAAARIKRTANDPLLSKTNGTRTSTKLAIRMTPV